LPSPPAQNGGLIQSAVWPLKPFDKLSGLSLDARQQYLDDLIARYTRTKTSKQMAQTHRPHLADPVQPQGSGLRGKKFIPLWLCALQDPLWDVDGNEYIDMQSGLLGPTGHSPAFIRKAVEGQLSRFRLVRSHHWSVAKAICELTGTERVTFCNTGSVLAAMGGSNCYWA